MPAPRAIFFRAICGLIIADVSTACRSIWLTRVLLLDTGFILDLAYSQRGTMHVSV